MEFSDGATLVCDVTGRKLNGNLLLGPDAKLDVAIDVNSPTPLTLTNPFATLNMTANETSPVVISVEASPNHPWRKNESYPIIALAGGATFSNHNPDYFALELPKYVSGHVECTAGGVNLIVDGVRKNTVLIIR